MPRQGGRTAAPPFSGQKSEGKARWTLDQRAKVSYNKLNVMRYRIL
ncbi:hypothetical protein HMPREF1545_03812 [Oscillibacter sp. KLE 1728]|nr:hypothetical protein HMPREF1545_03812 [Oscillibacter sp. KLE 1728]